MGRDTPRIDLRASHRHTHACIAVWLVHEQVAIAALELHDEKLATALVRNVHMRFPKGTRASRLAVRVSTTGLTTELGAVLGNHA